MITVPTLAENLPPPLSPTKNAFRPFLAKTQVSLDAECHPTLGRSGNLQILPKFYFAGRCPGAGGGKADCNADAEELSTQQAANTHASLTSPNHARGRLLCKIRNSHIHQPRGSPGVACLQFYIPHKTLFRLYEFPRLGFENVLSRTVDRDEARHGKTTHRKI